MDFRIVEVDSFIVRPWPTFRLIAEALFDCRVTFIGGHEDEDGSLSSFCSHHSLVKDDHDTAFDEKRYVEMRKCIFGIKNFWLTLEPETHPTVDLNVPTIFHVKRFDTTGMNQTFQAYRYLEKLGYQRPIVFAEEDIWTPTTQ